MQSRILIIRALLLSLLAVLAGCTGFSTMQTARALPKSKVRGLVGLGLLNSDSIDGAVSSISGGTVKKLFIPSAELMVRGGLGSRFDLGLRIIVPGPTSLDTKFQFLSLGPIAMALGAGLGYYSYSLPQPDGNNRRIHVLDLTVPYYFSIDLSEVVGLYSAAKYIYKASVNLGSKSPEFFAASGGLRLGSKVGVCVEATYIKDIRSSFNAIQGNIGLFFGDSPSWPAPVAELPEHLKQEGQPIGGEPIRRVAAAESIVKKVLPKGALIAVSHFGSHKWDIGEYVCVTSQGLEIACGEVMKSNKGGAIVKLQFKGQAVTEGMTVRPSNRPQRQDSL